MNKKIHFTLIEVLVAMFILGTVSVVILTGFQRNMHNLQKSRKINQAVSIARTRLAQEISALTNNTAVNANTQLPSGYSCTVQKTTGKGCIIIKVTVDYTDSGFADSYQLETTVFKAD